MTPPDTYAEIQLLGRGFDNFIAAECMGKATIEWTVCAWAMGKDKLVSRPGCLQQKCQTPYIVFIVFKISLLEPNVICISE